MAGILRGEFAGRTSSGARPEQAGRRPVLILSHDVFNARSGTVIAVALTSQPQKAGFPADPGARGRASASRVGEDQPNPDLVGRTDRQRIARIAPPEVAKVIEGLNEILGA